MRRITRYTRTEIRGRLTNARCLARRDDYWKGHGLSAKLHLFTVLVDELNYITSMLDDLEGK